VNHFLYRSAHKRPLYSSPDIGQQEAIWAFSMAKTKWIATAKHPPALPEYCRLDVWQFGCFKAQQYQSYVDIGSQLFH
jgi:hypothetical protein